MIELTEQQRQELNSPEPLAIDPKTRETYVLVRQDIYQRIRRLLNEDEEGRLKSVLGVLVAAEQTTAHAPDHRAVPPHQGDKRRMVLVADRGVIIGKVHRDIELDAVLEGGDLGVELGAHGVHVRPEALHVALHRGDVSLVGIITSDTRRPLRVDL